MYLFPRLNSEVRRTVEALPAVIEREFPLHRRFRSRVYRDIAELSRLLTRSRGERSDAYLGSPALLSAYLRYFLPWNVYRLCRLLPALPLTFTAGDVVTDLGAGPLTLTLALWIARPDIRSLPLEFCCLDRNAGVLAAGKRLFQTLAGDSPWRIKTIHAPLDAPLYGPKARLVSALQVFNERYERIPQGDAEHLRQGAEKASRLLASLVREGGSILVLEPGVPWSGEWIAALRNALHNRGQGSCAPCPQQGVCPCPGGKGKWCHFTFDTEDAPSVLHTLSRAAGLPKERATLSFLFTGPGENKEAAVQGEVQALPVRILSDRFPVPFQSGNRYPRHTPYGRYGCSVRGLVLLLEEASGHPLRSGELVMAVLGSPEKRDPKTGSLIAYSPCHLIGKKIVHKLPV